MSKIKSWSVQEAKNHFSEVLAAARKQPQTVTKHGKAAVVILDAEEYSRLRKADVSAAPSFVELLLCAPRGGDDFARGKIRPRDVDF